jgi:F420H(2)-dependent quinone reductase
MAKYVPSPRDWVREQVELYENSGGTKGTTLRDTGLPVVLVTHRGNKTGAIRKTPLMRVKDGDNYILIGSQGGAPKDPAWAHNLRVNPHIELRDETIVRPVRVREVKDALERARLWTLAVAAYPPYADYQARTERQIPVLSQSRNPPDQRATVSLGVLSFRSEAREVLIAVHTVQLSAGDQAISLLRDLHQRQGADAAIDAGK